MCICVCMRAHIHTYMDACRYTYAHISIFTSVHMRGQMRMYMDACVYKSHIHAIHRHIHTCIHTHICIYIYTYPHMNKFICSHYKAIITQICKQNHRFFERWNNAGKRWNNAGRRWNALEWISKFI